MSQDHSDVLVVLIRGWTEKGKFPRPFVDFIAETLPCAQIRAAELDMRFWSTKHPVALIDELLRQVDCWVHELAPRRILIVSFSAGTLLARGLILRAHGHALLQTGDATGPAMCWADRIDRVVLMGGILRGWTISSATPKIKRFLIPAARKILLAVRLLSRRRQFILYCERGEPFVVDLRLRFLRLLRDKTVPVPSFIYILGAKDEIISPADALDVGPNPYFTFLEVPGSNHMELLDLAGSDPRVDERRSILRLCLAGDIKDMAARSINDDDIDDYLEPLDRRLPRPVDEQVMHAVIVLHGIRDEGFWTKRIARKIKEVSDRTKVRAPTPSYGYFSMWNFVNLSARREKTKWLLEQYADVKTYFPNAQISFAGHSNATLLAVNALELCPAVSFKRMYLAGSVLPKGFLWHRYDGRVECAVNVTTSDDYVVGLFTASIEALGLKWLGIGGAGYYGFIESPAPRFLSKAGPLRGGHGAGVAEDRWQDIATFLVDGKPPIIDELSKGRDVRSWRSRLTLGAYRFALLAFPAFTVWAIDTFVGEPWNYIMLLILLYIVVRAVRLF